MSAGPVSAPGQSATRAGACGSDAPAPPGWYGKLAGLGDFAQRRLPADFVRLSDAWMAQVMSQCRAELGARWLDLYLQAPVWRFAWAPGMGVEMGGSLSADPGTGAAAPWWFGVLMPSCDKVGRYFPLLVAQARAQAPRGAVALAHLDAWLAHLGDAATRTLTEGATVETFEQALRAAPPWPVTDRDAAMSMTTVPAGPAASAPLSPLETLGADLHATQRRAGSLWWCPGAATHAARVRALPGLPSARDFAGLLGG